MAPGLTTDLHGVLESLLDLYGAGSPAARTPSAVAAAIDALDGHKGRIARDYGELQGMRSAVAQAQADRDAVVHKAVAHTGNGTVTGRGRLADHIANFRAQAQAIAGVGNLRFSGPALLDAAHATITDASRQVDSDLAAARKQAAAISPLPVAQSPRGRVSAARRRPRRRTRTRRVATTRTAASHRSARPIRPITSDGTLGGQAVSAASAWLGTPYVWGGGGAGGPSGGGFDCSGLTQYAVAQATDGRVVLPRTTYEQIYSGVRVPVDDVRPGDLVFPASSFSARGPEHVQLAAGNGMVIEAPYTGSTVKWSRMSPESVVIRVM